MSRDGPIALLIGGLLLAAGLAGCLGPDEGPSADAEERRPSAHFVPCVHPWPCGDGSEWPKDLVADRHPLDPPVLPAGLSIDDGEVLAANASSLTYRFEGPLGGPRVQGIGPASAASTAFDVPAGLFLDLSASLTLTGDDGLPPEGDATAIVRVLDDGGEPVCEKVVGFAVVEDVYVGGTPGPCSARVQPLQGPAHWQLEVESEHNTGAAQRFRVDLTLAVTEPFVRFTLAGVEHVEVPSFDGTVLDGWIVRPALPEGVKPPVVVISSPYWGLNPTPETERFFTPERVESRLLAEGYALAIVSVRGTGNSGGCLEMFGPNEQRDQAFLVDWLAGQDWHNGRVAMMGNSYVGTTAWEAAIQAPDALKTIVVAGTMSDFYTFLHTPQGAAFNGYGLWQAQFAALVTAPPPVLGGTPEAASLGHAPVVPERVCPEVAEVLASTQASERTDARDAAFWSERRLIDRFANVTAAVLLTHGFQDAWDSGHQQQEVLAWHALPATTPRHQLEGQWQHDWPHENSFRPAWSLDDWEDRLVAWYDFWLKGLGSPPDQLGTVEYQDGDGTWRVSSAWPPAELTEEALYLVDATLAPSAGDGVSTFLSAPEPVDSRRTREGTGWPAGPLCSALDGGPSGRAVAFVSAPVDEPVLVAGNPFASLEIESSLPGGLVGAALFDLGPGFACPDGVPRDVRAWTVGAADLRFHAGNLDGRDFPVNTPTPVRIDLTNIAEVLDAGHRLALVLSYNDPDVRLGQGHTPEITVHGDASHLVLPIVDGTLGGTPPPGDHPPRPHCGGDACGPRT